MEGANEIAAVGVGASPRAETSAIVEAFGAFYRHEWPGMVRLATGLVGSAERGREVVQDAFERTYLRWATLDRPGAYLRTAVVNGARSDLRRQAVARRFTWPSAATVEHTSADDELLAAVRRLSPKRRIVVVLRFWADLAENDIAELLGVRPATVRSLLHRALRDLREEMDR